MTNISPAFDQAELHLENVSVSFPIYHGGSRSLKKSLLFRGSAGQLGSDASDRITVEALRNVSLRFNSGDRVALIAETVPEFAALFCACVYAGAWPVPLPLPTTFGGKESYIDQLAVQLSSADPKILLQSGIR